MGWSPRHGHVSQLRPDAAGVLSGWNDCWEASLARYLCERDPGIVADDDWALIDAVGRTARGAPDAPDNADTTLDEAARSLGAYGIAPRWTASFAEALAAPWAICLVDGTGLAPAQYPADWFGAAGGGNHFVLWLPAWQGSADWYDDPLAYFNGQQDCRYDRGSVAASFYGAYLLPDTGCGEAAPDHGAIIARCALKVRPDHRCLALANLAAGSAVTLLAGASGAWRQVGAAGKIGWVLGANVGRGG